jgi:hypothetical protein
MALIVLCGLTSDDIPGLDSTVARSTDDSVVVDHDSVDSGAMALDGGEKGERFNEQVVATKRTSVGICEAVNDSSGDERTVPSQGVAIPDLDRLVFATGDDVSVVEAKIEHRLVVCVFEVLD